MASIGGLTSSTSTSATSGLQGYGGLASGINRDEIIEQLTSGTQSKIDAKNQEKTLLEWTQEAIQNITGKMYEFSQKYTSYSSSTNLLGSTLFNRTDITMSGKYSDCLSVSGYTNTGSLPEILGVKQLAQNASAVSAGTVSDQKLETGGLNGDFETDVSLNAISGEKIYLKYGDTSYTVELPEEIDLPEETDGTSFNANEIARILNSALNDVSTESGNLGQLIQFGTDGEQLTIKSMGGNNITITGATGSILDTLGIANLKGEEIGVAGAKGSDKARAFQIKSTAEWLEGQSVSFVYNGETKWIEMPTKDELGAYKGKNDQQGNKIETDIDCFRAYLQDELDDVFGSGRITVDLTTDNKISFRTTIPGETETVNGEKIPMTDESSVLSISSGTGKVLDLFGIEAGESNRLNLNTTIADAGWGKSAPDNLGLTINGHKVEVSEDTTLQEIMDIVNNDAKYGVTISYQENTDKFIVTSTQAGASGKIELRGGLAFDMFGKDKNGSTEGAGVVTEGQDAVFAVRYAGTNEVVEVSRGSNTLTIDGLAITAEKAFGYENGTKPTINDEAVSFKADIDTEKVTEVVKEMIDEYNEILKLINDELQTKPDRDYEPLTSAQKAEMSESEIELWEEKAKEGLLFGDNDIRSLSTALRFVIPAETMVALQEIGISTSSEYSDNGKLVFDEEKFKAALEEDPENVRQLFSEQLGTTETGAVTGGFMRNMESIMDRFAAMTGSTKGILVERAGSEYSPLAALDNSILDQINDIDDQIDQLLDQLTNEQDRYIRQFTQLETLVAQMNSQSSYLASMFSSGY